MRTRDRSYPAILSDILDECPGEVLCSECLLSIQNNGCCPGCDSNYQRVCLKRICDLNCNVCSGGKHAHTRGCCGRAPASWRGKWEKILRSAVQEYAPASIEIRCRLIPVIYPQIRSYRIPERFPQIDTWAVPIHKVASRKGQFRDSDLKDYLCLPSDRKLILSTCAADDYQEMLWEKGAKIKYKKHRIDYWFPAHFSIYDDDSKLYQFASARRQQLNAIQTKSQFIWFRLGEHIPIKFLASVHNASSVLISKGQVNTPRNRAILHNEVEEADRWFPPQTTFFILGTKKDLPISDQRSCFEINSTWLMRALKGRNLAGQKEPLDLSIEKLLIKNLSEALKSVHPDIS